MTQTTLTRKNNFHGFFQKSWRQLLLFLAVFGPATITAMADNDATGVATYSISGAQLGYPILFLLIIITVLLAITQEMGMRLTLVTRRGLADLVRERFGVRAALFMFAALFIANIGTIIADLAAIKATSGMLHLPALPAVMVVLVIAFLLITRGNYKMTQRLMLFSSLFFFAYIFSAVKARPDWGQAFGNLLYPHGVQATPAYLKSFLIIGMGVLGTTITPWGQFFISSFASDKRIDKDHMIYSQVETYWGAFLTNFFSFFMIVATAATLFVHHVPLTSGEQAAMAIEPFAGALAGRMFAAGIINAGFMGLVVVSLSTAYAFAEFFGLSGSLNDSFKKSKTFYILYIVQLAIALLVVMFPEVSFFQLVVATQVVNAVALPFIFYYLIRLTNDRSTMREYANNVFQKTFAIACTVVIVVASVFTMAAMFFHL
ncbi:MAG: NRAMP family divalent metal transporter [Bacteroidota bacterium]